MLRVTHDGLNQMETETMREIARRDVRHWEWSFWASMAAKQGRFRIGMCQVFLPYQINPGMPRLRIELNRIYIDVLQERARYYGMEIEMVRETGGWKFFLVAPIATDENLREMMMAGHSVADY